MVQIMKQNLYIFSDSLLKRRNNTIYFQKIIRDRNELDNDNNIYESILIGRDILIPSGDKKFVPVENINAIFAFGALHFNSLFLYFLSRHFIPLHIYSYAGKYAGSYLPLKEHRSGNILAKQLTHLQDAGKRLYIAKQFIKGAAVNQLINLKYYNNRDAYLDEEIDYIETLNLKLDNTKSIGELMGIEGNIKKVYYSCWSKIFTYPVDFYKRVKNPPNNMINSLISYGNMIVYAQVLNEIYHSRLYPEIGYLHSTGENKLPLSYDIAEIFKPIITDRIIFKLINKRILHEKNFYIKNGFCRISKRAKQIFTQEFDSKLYSTINVRELNKNLSFKSIIAQECNKLITHLNDEKTYKPFKMRW